jgi:glutaredoxin
MLKKMQLVQSITAIGMAIGAITPVVIVRADPSLPANIQKQSISAPQTISPSQPVPNNTTQPSDNTRKSVATGAKIKTISGAAETALVEYLAANGVKFYGAYWCSHCQQQKSLFGADAATKLPYIECAADGENSQRQLCKNKNIQMFPTWVIKGKYFTGTKDLKEIASLTGYKGSLDFKYHK